MKNKIFVLIILCLGTAGCVNTNESKLLPFFMCDYFKNNNETNEFLFDINKRVVALEGLELQIRKLENKVKQNERRIGVQETIEEKRR